MNYFGLFFSFMIPSIILGFMIAAACIQERAILAAVRSISRPRRTRKLTCAAIPLRQSRSIIMLSSPISQSFIYTI